jgi:hypothetical protein
VISFRGNDGRGGMRSFRAGIVIRFSLFRAAPLPSVRIG